MSVWVIIIRSIIIILVSTYYVGYNRQNRLNINIKYYLINNNKYLLDPSLHNIFLNHFLRTIKILVKKKLIMFY